MMALRLHELLPIDDLVDHGCSLIDEIFGRSLYVEDESGRLQTTLRNHRLLNTPSRSWDRLISGRWRRSAQKSRAWRN